MQFVGYDLELGLERRAVCSGWLQTMRRKVLGIAGVEVVMILLAVYRVRARVVRDGYNTSYLGTSETTMAWGLTYSFCRHRFGVLSRLAERGV
jgi:hypothetical protein